MVPAGDKRSDLPPHAAVNFNGDQNGAGGLILAERGGIVRRDRYGSSVNKRRPNVDLVVALISRRNLRPERDLLIVVGGVGIEFVVINADFVVGIAGGDCDLEIGGEEIGDGGVEGVNGDVLEDESGLSGPEDGPNE